MSRTASHRSLLSLALAVGLIPCAARADLSDWVGFNNTASGNNYGLIDSNTVGGSLLSKFEGVGAYFADTRLNLPGGWLTYDTGLGFLSLDEASVRMRVSFENLDNTLTDPALVVGYFNDDVITGVSGAGVPQIRAGITFADTGTPDAFRVQVVGGTSNNSTVNVAVLPNGTYDFELDFYPDSTDDLRVRAFDLDGVLIIERSISLTTAVRLNSFGILQPGTPGFTNNQPYNLSVTNISYTGQGPIDYVTWAASTGGDWTSGANWASGNSPTLGSAVKLGAAVAGASTIQLDTVVGLDELQLDSAVPYTITGTGSLNFDFSFDKAVVVGQGNHTIGVPVGLFKSAKVEAGEGSSVTFDGGIAGTGLLTKTGAGAVSAAFVRTAGGLVVADGEMSLTGDGEAGASVIPSLVVDPGAALDIADAPVIINYSGTSPLATISALVSDGRVNSSSIDTSGAVVVLEAITLGSPASFYGQPLDADSIVLLATLKGDTDLNRLVEFPDLLTIAQNYNTLSGANWTIGDFDGDGAVGFSDLLALAQNYGTPFTLAQAESIASLGQFAADWALARSVIPEPTTISIFAAGAALSLRRRR